jgi:hypothetical protein
VIDVSRRCGVCRRGQPIAVIFDGRTLQNSCESGLREQYDSYKRRKGSKVHMAVDTLGHLLTLTLTVTVTVTVTVMPADKHERAQVNA